MTRTKANKGQKGEQEEENTMQPTVQTDPECSGMKEHGDKKKLAKKTKPGDLVQELSWVTRDLLEFKCEMKKTHTDFQVDLRKDIRQELTIFKQDMSQKLAETTATLQAQSESISEAKTRISELKASGPVAREGFLMLINHHSKSSQEKLMDLENRSRRSNMSLPYTREYRRNATGGLY